MVGSTGSIFYAETMIGTVLCGCSLKNACNNITDLNFWSNYEHSFFAYKVESIS